MYPDRQCTKYCRGIHGYTIHISHSWEQCPSFWSWSTAHRKNWISSTDASRHDYFDTGFPLCCFSNVVKIISTNIRLNYRQLSDHAGREMKDSRAWWGRNEQIRIETHGGLGAWSINMVYVHTAVWRPLFCRNVVKSVRKTKKASSLISQHSSTISIPRTRRNRSYLLRRTWSWQHGFLVIFLFWAKSLPSIHQHLYLSFQSQW